MLRVCPSCGRKNRIPDDRLTAEARCGACKTALPPPAEPIDADPALFAAAIGQSHVDSGGRLVDGWTTVDPRQPRVTFPKSGAGDFAASGVVS